MQIRPARSDDADAITDLINVAFRSAEQFFIDVDRIDLQEVLRLLDAGEFLLAESNDQLVGCVFIEPRGEGTYLGLLSVSPTQQQSGVGSELMLFTEARCRGRQRKFIDILVVHLRVELIGYYKKRGYVETGTLPFPPDLETKVPCHFITMRKMLT
jgi:N-acetylglutamate synthase-like GNAT family acetyltransferase